MFLPRKLQKRKHPGRNTNQESSSVEAAELSKDVDDEGAGHEGASAGSSSTSTNKLSQEPQQPSRNAADLDGAEISTSRTKSETEKLDRLIEFLFLRLSPLSLVLSAGEQAGGASSLAAILNQILGGPGPAGNDGTAETSTTTTHLARLLSSIPGLQTRCKSIALLAEALQEAQKGPTAGWYAVSRDGYHLEWTPSCIRSLRELSDVFSSPSALPAVAPLLVYIESIPPRIRTRSQAAAYLANLIRSDHGTVEDVLVLHVLEPCVVDDLLMAASDTILPSWMLEGRWTSGRGFFLLNSPMHVGTLCRKYQWDLATRSRAESKAKEGGEVVEPIRCHSWSGWVEMKEAYLDWQRRRQHAIDGVHLKDATQERQEGQPRDDDEAAYGQARSDAMTQPAPPEVPPKDDIWYRGTILLLSLPPPADTTLTTPPFSTESELTPSFLNRHLKPQLEQRVSESISYIHTYSPPSSSPTADAAMVAIRTAHPTYAAQLVTHIPALFRMTEAEEDAYWSNLPLKVRTAAHSRILALNRTLTPAQTDTSM